MNKISKSAHGNKFKDQILEKLKDLKTKQVVDDIEIGKNFSLSVDYKPQFFAPFFVTLRNRKRIVIFTMTSIRSDRLKIDQWDSWGIKNSINDQNIKSIVVLPDDLSSREDSYFLTENEKLKSGKYFSEVDAILKIKDLEKFLVNLDE